MNNLKEQVTKLRNAISSGSDIADQNHFLKDLSGSDSGTRESFDQHGDFSDGPHRDTFRDSDNGDPFHDRFLNKTE